MDHLSLNLTNLTNNITSNTTSNGRPIPQFDIFAVVLGFYVLNIMMYTGAALNLICILIFIKIVKDEQPNQGNLFKYLLLKSVFDCLFCIQNFPQPFYYRADFSISESYVMQYWFKHGMYYLYPLTSQLSVWFEIFASIDCLFLISRKFPFHKTKICFWMVTISLITINILYYIPFGFLRYTIEEYSDGGYYTKITKLGSSFLIDFQLMLVHNVFRDILPLFISIVLNGIIFYYIRQLTVSRKKMTASVSSVTNQTSAMVKKAQKTEWNKIKMMMFTSVIHIFHIPLVFFNFNMFNVRSNSFLTQLCLLSINVSYFIPIVAYVAFNSTFERYVCKIFFCFKCKK
jgi:hypothetical protein